MLDSNHHWWSISCRKSIKTVWINSVLFHIGWEWDTGYVFLIKFIEMVQTVFFPGTTSPFIEKCLKNISFKLKHNVKSPYFLFLLWYLNHLLDLEVPYHPIQILSFKWILNENYYHLFTLEPGEHEQIVSLSSFEMRVVKVYCFFRYSFI